MADRSKLLLVDDEPNIRTLLSAILIQRGFEVRAAATVPEALNLIASTPFDVLISDLNIGEAGDGFTVVSAMRRTQPDAATFILTGYPAFESALEAIRQQVDDYFVKPANIEQMIARINTALYAPRGSRPRTEPKRLREVLAGHKREIFTRWLAAAKEDEQIRSTTLSDEDIADHIPQLIEEIIGAATDQPRSGAALAAAQRHGILRFRQGCGIPATIREARLLHEVISHVVQENLIAVEISFLITDIMAAGETIQAFLEESIRAFINARHAATESVSSRRHASILLLSGDRELSLLRYFTLQQGGFSAARADSRSEALTLLERKFDALVVSYSLSIESINEFTELFRKVNPASPVICVVKGNWQDLKVQADFTVNGDDGPEALLETLETAMTRTRLRLVK